MAVTITSALCQQQYHSAARCRSALGTRLFSHNQWYLLLLLVVASAHTTADLIARPKREDDSVSCQAGVVSVGRNATITCSFNRDLNETKGSFAVLTTPQHAPRTNRPKRVLLCYWRENAELECQHEEGISFNNIVSDHITVEISEASEQFAGQYFCQTVPPGSAHVQPCQLTVEATGTPGDEKGTTAPTDQTPGTGNCNCSCSSEATIRQQKTALIFLGLLLAATSIALIVLFYMYKRIRGKRGSPDPHEELSASTRMSSTRNDDPDSGRPLHANHMCDLPP